MEKEKMYSLREIQLKGLEILEEIDRICRKNNIQYFLDSGTLLGAVRHSGFIPWDDDVDVIFTRKHYENFIKCAGKELAGDLELVMPEEAGNGSFRHFIPKIVDKTFAVSLSEREKKIFGDEDGCLGVDLFVLDKVPDSFLGKRIYNICLLGIYGLAMGHRKVIYWSEYSLPQCFVIKCLATVGKRISLKKIVEWYDEASKKHYNRNYREGFVTNFPIKYYRGFCQINWYAEACEMSFENRLFWVPACYKEILENQYGDYMVLPPEEKRVPEHFKNISGDFK